MNKRTVFTTITPLPSSIPRKLVVEYLHEHVHMIDLNPFVEERHPIDRAPARATPEEYHAKWYQITDRISYMPGVKGKVVFHCCFHDLGEGVQTHVYAPMGLDIKEKWTIGGNEPGEERRPVEMGLNAPRDGLYLREDADMNCNRFATSFVKEKLLKSHKVLIERLIERAKIEETKIHNERVKLGGSGTQNPGNGNPMQSPGLGVASPTFSTFQKTASQSNLGPPGYHEMAYNPDAYPRAGSQYGYPQGHSPSQSMHGFDRSDSRHSGYQQQQQQQGPGYYMDEKKLPPPPMGTHPSIRNPTPQQQQQQPMDSRYAELAHDDNTTGRSPVELPP